MFLKFFGFRETKATYLVASVAEEAGLRVVADLTAGLVLFGRPAVT
jgi:hypothetical protein